VSGHVQRSEDVDVEGLAKRGGDRPPRPGQRRGGAPCSGRRGPVRRTSGGSAPRRRPPAARHPPPGCMATLPGPRPPGGRRPGTRRCRCERRRPPWPPAARGAGQWQRRCRGHRRRRAPRDRPDRVRRTRGRVSSRSAASRLRRRQEGSRDPDEGSGLGLGVQVAGVRDGGEPEVGQGGPQGAQGGPAGRSAAVHSLYRNADPRQEGSDRRATDRAGVRRFRTTLVSPVSRCHDAAVSDAEDQLVWSAPATAHRRRATSSRSP
jgi:hypothetical protein